MKDHLKLRELKKDGQNEVNKNSSEGSYGGLDNKTKNFFWVDKEIYQAQSEKSWDPGQEARRNDFCKRRENLLEAKIANFSVKEKKE